jgi:hypothetical protein
MKLRVLTAAAGLLLTGGCATPAPPSGPDPVTTSVSTSSPVPSPTPTAVAQLAPTTAAPTPAAAPLATGAPAGAGNGDGSGSCGSDEYRNSSGVCVPRPTHAPAAPAGATAECNDGTYSFSQHHSGTCSHHGGVKRWL